jgi:heptosyltransferase-2
MPEPAHVLVIAPNWLGDAVMALPAVADLRRHFPRVRLTVAARPSVAPLFALVPGVDGSVTLGWRGNLTARADRRRDTEQLRSLRPDMALLLPNSFASAWLARVSGIRERWGYASDLRRPLLTRSVTRPRRSLHQGAYYQHLVRELGIDNGPLEPCLNVPAAAMESARTLLSSRGWDGTRPLVVIAPGAAYGTAKRWLPRHFSTLIAALADKRHVQCVLVGSAGDAPTTGLVRQLTADASGLPTIDLTGATDLQTLAAVMRLAHACVSNDSGAMHVAAATATPLAALFGPTRDHETAPLATRNGRVEVLTNPVWCRPCMLRECPIDHRCMAGLRPERVLASVERLLEGKTE